MGCCTFKQPWFMTQADSTSNNSRTSNSHHHRLMHQTTRNSIKYCNYLSFPLMKRFDDHQLLFNNLLSCSSMTTAAATSTTRGRGSLRRSCPPSFSFSLKDGISSSLAATDTDGDDDDDDDDEDHKKNKHQKKKKKKKKNKSKKKVICGYEAPLPPPPDYSALVLVNCKYEAPDLEHPWLTEKGFRRNKNGFIIQGRRILTCAHCIEHHTKVTIKKLGSNTIYRATVLTISHDFDLAMLTVPDVLFWEGLCSVEFGDMPSLRDELTNMSYLECNTSITSRSGFISHMGMIPYSHGALKLPGFEVSYDSDITVSGSAIFNVNGKCVGMAFHEDAGSNNPGRVIPVTIINHFIQDYDWNGRCTGLPIFGVKWQKMENHDLRMSKRMQHDQEGVLIIEIADHCPELLVLKPFDVILSIDGVKIANDGTVPFVQGQRIDFNYLFTQKYTGDKVLVKVLRKSNIREFSIELATHKQYVLGAGGISGRPQEYYIIGGLVFTNLTIPYIRSAYAWAQHEKCGRFLMDEALFQALFEERVVVVQVLEAEVNKGYDMFDIVNKEVMSLNGKRVKDMNELVSMVESCREEYLEFLLQEQKVVVLRRITAIETTPKILETYGIPSAMSDYLEFCRTYVYKKSVP